MESATAVLLQLAEDFRSQGCFLQAAKCLQPVCSAKDALPRTRATGCILYAQLLLDQFDNVDIAKDHLLQAERELRTSRASYTLLCQVQDGLARCHRYSAAPAQVVRAYTTGLGMCAKGAKSKDAAVLAHWRTYFLFQLAEFHLSSGSAEAALKSLAEIEKGPGLSMLEQALLGLCRGVAYMHAGQLDDVNDQLTACATVLEEIVDAQGFSTEEATLMQLMRAQYFLMYAAMTVAVGRGFTLHEDCDIPVLIQLQEALAEVMEGGGCTSMPASAIAVLGSLLHAALLRSAAKGSKAAVHLGKAEEMADQCLAEAMLDWKAQEGDLPAAVRVGGQVYVLLKAMALEQRALGALLVTDLAGAAKHVAELVAALDRFPTMLGGQVPAVHMLLGHYAQAFGDNDAAKAHFDAVLKQGPPRMHRIAALAAALCELQRVDGSPTTAAEYLVGQGLADHTALAALQAHERTTAQLVNGLLLQRQGDSTGARMLLTKALKQSHAMVGSTQLVGQVLNAMAPVQRERRDLAGAQAMFDSAYVLLKSIGDLPSMLTSLRGICAIARENGDAELIEKTEEYAGRKAQNLEARMAEAVKLPCHTSLLQWKLT